jgi:hypothetical protein
LGKRKGMIVFKFVCDDYGSLCDKNRVIYGTEWQEVPGNGAYCSETGEGITLGGDGERLIVLEVEEELFTKDTIPYHGIRVIYKGGTPSGTSIIPVGMADI